MRRLILALVVGLVALAASAGAAFAADPVQSSTQSSSTGQAAIAGSSATQIQPSNQNISVRVLSPGDDGNVYQSNNANSSANASNTASTTQNATQTLGGGCGCATAAPTSGNIGDVLGTAMQAAGQAGPQTQTAAPAAASQQSNAAPSTGDASNAAPATQTQTQSAPSGGSGVQSSIQGSSTDQGAVAASSATQVDPSNSNISVRVLSPGDNGNVAQSNDASSHADASNSATTSQTGTQSGGSGGVQSSIQGAATKQGALGLSSAEQIDPSNSNTSVRVLSPGDNGNVYQSNNADSSAKAKNSAPTTQTATQTQSGPSCGCSSSNGGSDVQSSDQSSFTLQGAVAASSAKQIGASNSNDPVRIGSYGDNGAVFQSNDTSSHADASNSAPVTQTATQDPSGGSSSSCGCSSSPSSVQALGQQSFVGQLGIASSSATQIGASNSSNPVRIGSAGNDGFTLQSNDTSSHADTHNSAPVTQTGTQTQSGSSCGCSSGPAVQALGQESFVGQLGVADSSAKQVGASNSSDPVRIASYGNGGFTVQQNNAHSSADAHNSAPVTQTGTQTQSGSGIQALGQESKIGQAAFAASSAEQLPGRSECGCGGGGSFGNSSSPVRIASGGNDGFLFQSNDASSHADASNYAAPTQTGTQTQSGSSCGCGGLGVQALGQSSKVDQLAVGLSSALQIGAHNSSSPVRIKSWGGNGSTFQSNGAFSRGDSSNVGRILQSGQQLLV